MEAELPFWPEELSWGLAGAWTWQPQPVLQVDQTSQRQGPHEAVGAERLSWQLQPELEVGQILQWQELLEAAEAEPPSWQPQPELEVV